MTILLAGMAIFFGVHLLPLAGSLRGRLIGRLGTWGYRGAFSLVSAIGFALLVYGKTSAPFVALWSPPTALRALTMVLVYAGFLLLAGKYLGSNLNRITRHPMLWGVLCWALGHLLSNGDFASVLLFGGFGAYAAVDMLGHSADSDQKFAPVRLPLWRDAVAVAGGSLAFVGALIAHGAIFGLPVATSPSL